MTLGAGDSSVDTLCVHFNAGEALRAGTMLAGQKEAMEV